jgi:predicted nucleic acid-binding protein
MPGAVVFDTNAYQRLASAQLPDLVAAEARDDVVAYADSWVMIELISKLPDLHVRPHARAALRKQLVHCGDRAPRMVIDCEEQVCRLLLGVAPAGYPGARAAVTTLAERVARAAPENDLSAFLPAAQELRGHVLRIERERASLLMDNFIRLAVPGADSWDALVKNPAVQAEVLDWVNSPAALRALAASEVLMAYNTSGQHAPWPLPDEKVDLVLRHFRYPLAVEAAVLRGVVERGWDLTTAGRENSIWDAQIAFNAGQVLAEQRRITLVTDDKLLIDVANAEHVGSVVPLAGYLRARGIAA